MGVSNLFHSGKNIFGGSNEGSKGTTNLFASKPSLGSDEERKAGSLFEKGQGETKSVFGDGAEKANSLFGEKGNSSEQPSGFFSKMGNRAWLGSISSTS